MSMELQVQEVDKEINDLVINSQNIPKLVDAELNKIDKEEMLFCTQYKIRKLLDLKNGK